MTTPDARPERVYPHMCRDEHPEIGHRTDEERCPVCIERDRADAAESRLREVEAERDRWHSLVKSLCDEWNDECPPGCDSYAHEDDCGATSITVAMRKRGEEIAALRAILDRLFKEAK